MRYHVTKSTPPRLARGRKPKYPWAKTKPGESFFVRGGTQNRLNACAWRQTKRTGKRYTIRTTKKGVRVYCIAQQETLP